MSSKENGLIGVFPGTFDPPSLGHLDIIQRAAKFCKKLYVAIAVNSSKTSAFFSAQERLQLLQWLTQSIPHIEVVIVDGLVIDFVQQKKIDLIMRSLRSASDCDFEFEMALANRSAGKVETLFLMADPAHFHIRSSLIRELGQAGKPLEAFVATEVEEAIKLKLSK